MSRSCSYKLLAAEVMRADELLVEARRCSPIGAKVTRADILRVAKQYIQPDQLTIVAVGNPKEMPKPLSTLGPVNTIDLTIPEPKQQLAAADEASLARGKALLQRAQRARERARQSPGRGPIAGCRRA